MLQASTLRPGYLVSLKSSQRGNVKYDKRTIEADHVTDDGTKKAVWETERLVTDPEEHQRASDARMLARRTISKTCASTAFGLLCPEDKAELLDAAIAEARKIVDEFNGSSRIEKISVIALKGRIARDDEDAVKSINAEVRSLMEEMQDGLRNLDARAVRDAAIRARDIGQMLSPEAQVRVQFAIDAAREVATRIKAAGEQAAVEVDLRAIRRIEEQRVAFLDLDGERDIEAIPQQGRAVDLEPAATGVDLPRQPALQLEV